MLCCTYHLIMTNYSTVQKKILQECTERGTNFFIIYGKCNTCQVAFNAKPAKRIFCT